MNWPLIERELRRALRVQKIQQVRAWGTVGCAALACLFMLTGASSRGQGWGREFNSLLFLGGLVLIAQVPKYTVGIFAEERRNHTLGLLFLCGIGPLQLFLSKTLGAALVSFSRLLLLYPFLAIAFLGGGLSWQMFVATTCSLPLLLAYVFAVCVFASVLCREESTAMFVAVAIGAALAALPVAFNWLCGGGQTLLLLSPASAPYLAANRLSTGTIQDFAWAALYSIGWTLALLAAAATVLARVWQDKPDHVAIGSWQARLAEAIRGNATWRRQLAARCLGVNPFIWLALRDRWPVTLAEIVVTAGLGLWLLACVVWRDIWFSPAGMFVVTIVLNLALSWLVNFAAAKTIGDSRRTGTLELLLTTPMSHLDFVRGQLVALREQFAPIVRALLVINGVMVIAGLASRRWETTSLVLYLLIWAGLIFWTFSLAYGNRRSPLVMFWDALVCGRPAYVVLRQFGFENQLLGVIYFFFIGGQFIRAIAGAGFGRYPTGSLGECVFLILVLLAWFVIWRSNLNRIQKVEDRLAIRFRTIAAVPAPEPSDPRYKHWKIGEPFPDMLTDYLVGRVLQQVREREEPTRMGTNR
jgi:ABC-type Na+ efflux pump permease subunit